MELFVIEKCNSPLVQLQETGWPVWEKEGRVKTTEKQNEEEEEESYKTLYVKHVDRETKHTVITRHNGDKNETL